MSGIAGIMRLAGVDERQLQRMLAAMPYRGVDGLSHWHAKIVGFGHAMTFTSPESRQERLPAHSSDNALTITADARIDNRDELIAALGLKARTGESISDSELILQAYRHWGDDCLDRLLGDFVFAVWNDREKKLLVAMDPMGTRRLHFFHSEKLFAFATDIRALLAVAGIEKELDEAGFMLHAAAVTRLAPEKTCFAGISKLTGGKLLSIGLARSAAAITFTEREYRKIDAVHFSFRHPEECLEAFRELFDKAVGCRMRSAFPVATLLSGGLDSSAITCVAARHARAASQSLVAISSCLHEGESEPDERKFIDAVARQENIHVMYVVPKAGPADFLHSIHDVTEGPLSANPHVYFALYAAAREGNARVILDGLGGEWGATNHGHGYLAWLLRQRDWTGFFTAISAQARVYSQSRIAILRREILQPLLPPTLARLSCLMKGRSAEELSMPLVATAARKFALGLSRSSQTKREQYFGDMRSNRAAIIASGRTSKGDAAACYGLQAAYPFLDTRVLEFCLGLSPDWFVKNGWKRHFIRASMENVLPREIQWRKDKQPFSPSYYRLMQAGSKTYQSIIDELPASDLARAYVDVDRIGRTIKHLERRGSWAPVNGADYARNVVDYGIQSIVFFRWFQSL